MNTKFIVIEEGGTIVKIKTDKGAVFDLPRILFPENIKVGNSYILAISGMDNVRPELAKAILNELLLAGDET